MKLVAYITCIKELVTSGSKEGTSKLERATLTADVIKSKTF